MTKSTNGVPSPTKVESTHVTSCCAHVCTPFKYQFHRGPNTRAIKSTVIKKRSCSVNLKSVGHSMTIAIVPPSDEDGVTMGPHCMVADSEFWREQCDSDPLVPRGIVDVDFANHLIVSVPTAHHPNIPARNNRIVPVSLPWHSRPVLEHVVRRVVHQRSVRNLRASVLCRCVVSSVATYDDIVLTDTSSH
eukprot:CAMPEP_0183330500 /NCGR_PEP_ID=MMETSP0160_2-20130417/85335_1 /TAXON_ID=2839 ORGANISM="Odontella Sinensis, Strain Grunow 1884" /NCGR_SAMPLE_ID=MMETSP0160_2 /ASSEMBLY_ACC=CAM_ASM_000250 /LENGTH=189 /DNA_ID=CAMNT_0025498709 /DNA_START=804 /DNA_END=1373 /DNA_ORIENTATION=-